MTSSHTCTCGAALSKGALACGLCHRPVVAPAADEAPTTANGFLAPPPREPGPDPRAGYSRTSKGVTSFGPLGRVIITVLVLLPPTAFWLLGGASLLVPIVVWCLIAVPLVLRDAWKRERVAAPEWLLARQVIKKLED